MAKKKRHTSKMLIISAIGCYTSYLSNCWFGNAHGCCILKGEFPPDKDWFAEKHAREDLGFAGICSDYRCKGVIIPHKKPCKQELSTSA